MNEKPEIKPMEITPLKHICMTIGELPSSYLESMTYYEQLLWFTKFLQERMIPALDNNALAVEELQRLFIELQNYVNNYFDNLDVQEEINNKLDQMLKDGVLEQIIEQYLNSSALWCFDSVADMKEATNLINGSYARTYGFYNYADNGGALYKIRQITNDDIVDEMTIIALYDNTLIAELIFDDFVNVKQFGAKGDGTTNDSPNIQKAISVLGGKTIYIPSGTYIIDEPLTLSSSNTKLIGVGLEKPVLRKNSLTATNIKRSYNGDEFDFSAYPSVINILFPVDGNTTHICISNITISLESSSGRNKYGIIAPHCAYSLIENVRISNFKTGIIIQGWLNTIERCSFFTGEIAIVGYYSITTRIINCYFNATTLSVRNGANISIIGCQCDNGNPCYEFIDCKSVSMIGCSTETYSMVLRNTNSKVFIYGGDFEGHSSQGSTFGGFIINQQNGQTFVDNANVHFEDYAGLGEPNEKSIIFNTGGIVEFKGIVTTPYEVKNYLSGTNSVIKYNNTVMSKDASILQKQVLKKNVGTKVELFRLPFDYGKNLQVFLKGYGATSHTSISFESIITAVSTTSSGVTTNKDINVNDRNSVASKDTTGMTISITAEQDTSTNELVIYYNSSNNFHIPINYTVEYSAL